MDKLSHIVVKNLFALLQNKWLIVGGVVLGLALLGWTASDFEQPLDEIAAIVKSLMP